MKQLASSRTCSVIEIYSSISNIFFFNSTFFNSWAFLTLCRSRANGAELVPLFGGVTRGGPEALSSAPREATEMEALGGGESNGRPMGFLTVKLGEIVDVQNAKKKIASLIDEELFF